MREENSLLPPTQFGHMPIFQSQSHSNHTQFWKIVWLSNQLFFVAGLPLPSPLACTMSQRDYSFPLHRAFQLPHVTSACSKVHYDKKDTHTWCVFVFASCRQLGRERNLYAAGDPSQGTTAKFSYLIRKPAAEP